MGKAVRLRFHRGIILIQIVVSLIGCVIEGGFGGREVAEADRSIAPSTRGRAPAKVPNTAPWVGKLAFVACSSSTAFWNCGYLARASFITCWS